MSDKLKFIKTEQEFWDCLERRMLLETECIFDPHEKKQEEITLLTMMIDMWEYRQEIKEIEESGDYDFDPHTEWKRRWNERLKQQMFEELDREFWEEEMDELFDKENDFDNCN